MRFLKKLKHKNYIQCCLAILLTGFILWLTMSFWYGRILEVAFESQAQTDIRYQVFYTTASEQTFNQIQSVAQIVKSGRHPVEIVLPIEKIIKFRLDTGTRPGKVVISDLRIRGTHKLWFDHREFYQNQIDKFSAKDGKFYITSNQGDPYLAYKKELNLSGKIKIDWCRFIIISVLGFLSAYKFVQYLAKFKLEKHHSRIDIVMLAAFFGLLFVPMSHISTATKSEQENRTLAKFPQLTVNGGENSNFGEQFNAWYNDHFFGRNHLINLFNVIKYKISPQLGNDNVLVGKDGWLFYKSDNSLNLFANKVTLSEKQLENGLAYLKAFDEWCKKNGKEFYYVIAPDKNKVYGEYFRLIKKQKSDDNGIAHQFINYIRKHSDVKALYLLDGLMAHKKDGLLYYKHDTHWNEFGGYWGYKTLMDFMGIPAPKTYTFNTERHGGDLERLLGNTSIRDNTEYKKSSSTIPSFCKTDPEDRYNSNCTNPKGKKNVFMLRDSYARFLIPYLSDNFHKVQTHHYFGHFHTFGPKDLQDIKENYDIVILENVERYTPRIITLNFPKDSKD